MILDPLVHGIEVKDYTNGPSITQIGGTHYTKLPIQPYEFCYKNKLDYLQSNIIKYVVRFRDKDGIKDLDKAIHTLQVLKEYEYGKDTTS